jgi:ribonuclease-3
LFDRAVPRYRYGDGLAVTTEPSTIEAVARIVGYTFKDTSLLDAALTHASIAGHRLESNERLEFLGDAVLGFIVCEFLFQEYAELMEGEMTKIKSEVVSRRVCAQISEELGLDTCLSLGKGMTNRATLPSSVVAAVLESIIAAIFLDGGLEPAKAFILKHMEPYVRESALSTHQSNFKSVLQQHAQRHHSAPPDYVVLDEKGPDHSKAFEVCAEIDGKRFNSAWANSKKDAEQQAALHALQELNLARIDEEGNIDLDPISPSRRRRSGSRSTA